MKQWFQTSSNHLARRIGVDVIFLSTLLSIVISGIQIYSEFKREKDNVYDILNHIENIQVSNIAAQLWVLEEFELKHILNDLLGLPFVKYVVVYKESKLFSSVGSNTEKNMIERSFPLIYTSNNIDNDIGRLVVKASLDEVYQHVYDRALFIILFNLVKTFLVALFILFIFHQLVTRHLSDISSFLLNEHAFSGVKNLSLNRTGRKEDELDQLVDTINEMKDKLNQQFHEIDQQKQYLSQTLNSIGDAVISTDVVGKVTRMNPVAELLTGWLNEEAIGQPIKTVFPIINAETENEIENPIDKVIKTGETVYLSNHTTLLSKDGQRYQISDSAAPIKDDDGKIIGMVLVFNDITEQYELREQAKLNEKKYKILATVAPVGLFYTDVNGACVYVNEKWSEIAGLSLNDALSGGWFNAIHPEDRNKVYNEWNDAVKKGIPFKLEYRFQCKDKTNWVFGQAIAEEDENGNVMGYVGTITDITERKEAEYALTRSQKMDALGKLTGGIAHDYNNMLGVILGYSELLTSKLADNPALKKYAKEINDAGKRGTKLTEKLLSFSRHKKSISEPVDLNSLLKSESNMLEKTLTVSVNLTLDLAENLELIKVDSSDLENSIINLCINAGHAMEGAGDLIIKTRNTVLDGKCFVNLSIIDNGCGITNEDKEKIFDPFYSTKGDFGTGLGLSQVYGFVERSGGIITVESEVGEGTTFDILFPCSKENVVIEYNAEQATDDKQIGNENILVVDDELPLLDLCTEALSSHGYKVFSAESGEKALEILRSESIDLLLSDVIMPNMDGNQLADIVREEFPTVKIQLASGFTGNKAKNDFLFKHILQKPYHLETLLTTIRELLDS